MEARPTRRESLVLLLATAGMGCAPGIVLPQQDLLRDVHFRGPADRPIVALTFDDGPNGRCTDAVLDALAETAAPATFFLLGTNVASGANDHLLARMVLEGHAIGVHSYNHSVRRQFLHRLIEPDLRKALAAIAASLRRGGIDDPPRVLFYRPPFGFLTGAGARAAAEHEMQVVRRLVPALRGRGVRPAALAEVLGLPE
jgi:peptidoglycan/xylan/chitin deacetylase (PgdA/CDA1 family)